MLLRPMPGKTRKEKKQYFGDHRRAWKPKQKSALSCFLRVKRCFGVGLKLLHSSCPYPLRGPQLTRCLPLWPASSSTPASSPASSSTSAPRCWKCHRGISFTFSVSKHACDVTQRHTTSVKHTPEGPEGLRATGRRGGETRRRERDRGGRETNSERMMKKKEITSCKCLLLGDLSIAKAFGRENVPSLPPLTLSPLFLYLLLFLPADHNSDRFKNLWKIPFLAPLRRAARYALPWQ